MLEQAEDKAAGRAYLYGVICHFALDSACHPYVEKMIHASGLSHSEIEMEFDRFLLTEDHRDPLSYPLAGHIPVSYTHLDVYKRQYLLQKNRY